jgi:histidyl-tRNA synthetase
MKIQRCKGMRDLSPVQMEAFRLVEGICRDSFIKWGYGEVRTPTIEYLHLFTSAGTLTPGMLGKVYSFLDWDGWSGERVVLRPDGTIPVARLYTESLQSGLARLFYAANIFIFEAEAGKNRERWQCGAELIGAGSATADAELVALSLEILNKLGLKNIELRLSHAGLLKAILQKLDLSAEERHHLLDRILDGDADALEFISRKSEAGNTIHPLLNLNGQSVGFLRNQRAILARKLPEIVKPIDDFLKTVALLDELGLKYSINIASGAGFEYYTGLIFQLFAGEEKVGGGGRYDALIPSMGGGDVPASGFALYIDRLMELIKTENIGAAKPGRILVQSTSEKALKNAFNTAGNLRLAGYIAEINQQGHAFNWTIAVNDKPPAFTITAKSKREEFQSLADVLKWLERQVAD